MAHVPRMLVLASLVATATMAHADEPPPLRYTITPVLVKDQLTALDISLDTEAVADGQLLLRIGTPARDVRANTAADTTTRGYIKLTATARAPISLRYRIAGNANLAGDREDGAYLTADWSNNPCPAILAVPDAWVPRRIALEWKLPEGWRGLSSLPADRPVDAESLANAACLVGRHIVDITRPLGRSATLHAYTTDAAGSARLIDAAAAALRPFAIAAGGDAIDFPMYISTVPVSGHVFSAWSSGPFMLVVQQRDAPGTELADPLIEDYIRALAPKDARPAQAWYTDGLRTYLALSEASTAQALPRKELAAYLDRMSADYGNSPFRRASNAQITADWQRAPPIQAIPHQRGLLFGWLLDDRLRADTGGKTSMADVLRGMNPEEPDPMGALIAAVRAAGGGDITPLVDKYIVRGELLQLPPDALGPCMSVTTQADMYGWQVQHIADTCTP
ncbi:hypothetical protein [Luteibacter aegosomatissinici]|uniref:hypothetical protein n=1 Tax=Luteibacter aegosomatissinici TaxID=2911539 RepID=UPI001FFB31AA|nr:hypothetical protein [Luteibacter aegosomatissinici]UPG95206.1 hypothetical protein L2Y97_03595 [Luteibacter aegosomatissinici]